MMRLSALLGAIDRLIGRVIDGLGIFAGAVIAAVMLLITADVVSRSVLGFSLGFTIELSEYGLLVIGFLGAPWVARHSDHIRVDALIQTMSPRWSNRVLTLSSALALLACLTLTWFGMELTMKAYARGSINYKWFEIPQWTVLTIMPLGMALLSWEFAKRLVLGLMFGAKPPKTSPEGMI